MYLIHPNKYQVYTHFYCKQFMIFTKTYFVHMVTPQLPIHCFNLFENNLLRSIKINTFVLKSRMLFENVIHSNFKSLPLRL